MEIYAVGGSVRDDLLGLPGTDRDYVVVGATPGELLKLGYKPVGKDFPVFLHPETHAEYALARTERKTAPGYQGFAVHAAPDVTLEEDLARRDLTINAMARDEAGHLIDPFGGAADLKSGVLRHVGPAFAEDPVRILRAARFAARFDFTIAPATMALMREMVARGEVKALVAERVWQELARGLMEAKPSRMLRVLAECGAAAIVLPEFAGLLAGAAGERTLATLDGAAARGLALTARFALTAMRADESAIAALCDRLRVPQECRDLALLAARCNADIGQGLTLPAASLLRILETADALRRPDRFMQLLEVCSLAAGNPNITAAVARLRAALAAARGVDAGAIAKASGDPGRIKESVAKARLEAISHAVAQQESTPKHI